MAVLPAESVGPPQHRIAEVVERNFELIEGGGEQEQPTEKLGYELLPAGSFSSHEPLQTWILAYSRGLGNAAMTFFRHYTTNHHPQWPMPEHRTYEVNGHERRMLVTKAKPNSEEEDNDDPKKMLLSPGLLELDIGSAYLLHLATARRHPTREIGTLLTPGMSVRGSVLGLRDGWTRSLEATASENLLIAKEFANDETITLQGTSLNSCTTTFMAAENGSANPNRQINIMGVNLLAPAVGARDIPWNEVTQTERPDASDTDLVNRTTHEFYVHMISESIRMGYDNPEAIGETVGGLIVGYGLASHKAFHRFATVQGNLKGVKQGVKWSILREVADNYDLHVLGGMLCPIVKQTLPQYVALKEVSPATMIWLAADAGHGISLNGSAVADHFGRMEQKANLQLAA